MERIYEDDIYLNIVVGEASVGELPVQAGVQPVQEESWYLY